MCFPCRTRIKLRYVPPRKRAAAFRLAGAMLVSWPSYAYAQKIPWIVLPLAASPVVAILLAIALGAVAKSWRAGLGNALLVGVWVIWFWAASNYSTSDWLVWSSVLALVLHSAVIVLLIAIHAFRRARVRNEA